MPCLFITTVFFMLLVQPHLILSVALIHLPWTMFFVFFFSFSFLAATYIPKISIYIKWKLSIFKLMKHDIFTAYHYTGLIKLSTLIDCVLAHAILREILPLQKTLYSSNA